MCYGDTCFATADSVRRIPAAFVGAFFSVSLLIETLFRWPPRLLSSNPSPADYPWIGSFFCLPPGCSRPCCAIELLVVTRGVRYFDDHGPRPAHHPASSPAPAPPPGSAGAPRMRRFRRNRLACQPGHFLTLFGLSLLAEVLSNDNRWSSLRRTWYVPVLQTLPETSLAGFSDPTDFLDLKSVRTQQAWQFSLYPPNPTHSTINSSGSSVSRAAVRDNLLGTETVARYPGRLIYGSGSGFALCHGFCVFS